MIDIIENEPSRIVCVGRMLIEIPERFVPSYGMTYFQGWHFTTHIETSEEFDLRLQERIRDLSASKNGYGDRSLEIFKDVGGSWEGKILQYDRQSLRTVDSGVASYKDVIKVEGFLHSNGTSFDITSGISSAERNRLENLQELVHKLKTRDVDEIPQDSGFCFDGGFIVGKENSTLSEGITIVAGPSSSNDVAVVIDSTAGTKAPDSLLERVGKSSIRRDYPSNFKNLRSGMRQINGHKGEEMLERVTEDDGRSNHSFMWESIPVKDDIYRPQLTIEMSTGDDKSTARKKTPFTDTEAIALWDRISRSLKNRPTN